MSRRWPTDEELREAFQSTAVPSVQECAPDDVDRIWRAVAGELPPSERRSLVERLAHEPVLAEAWRMAHQLRRGIPLADAAAPSTSWKQWPSAWQAAAAVLILAVATTVVLRRDGTAEPTLREAGETAIESLVDAEMLLPRDAVRLRWSAGPIDSRYDVRVTTERLDPLVSVTDLSTPELVVDRRSLAGVPAGARILWQVTAVPAGGDRVVSPTFIARIGP